MMVRELFAKLGFKVDDKGAKEFDEKMDELKGTLVKVGAAAVAAAAAVGAMVHQVVQQADLIDKASQATGVNAQELQRLKYAADLSGVSFENLRASLGFLNRTSHAASIGSKEAGAAFASFGVRVTDASGKLRPSEALIGDLADKFKAMPDGTKKSALAMRVFGEAGTALIPLLNEGRAGIAGMGNELEQLGGVMSPEQIRAGVILGDTITKLKTSFFGLALTVAGPLLKPLNEVANRLLEWWKANRDGLKLQVEEGFNKIRSAIDFLVMKFRPLAEAARWSYEKLGGLKGVAAVLAIVLGVQLAGAFGGAALAMGKFIAGLKLATFWQSLAAVGPITMGLAIGVLILIIDELVTALQGGDTLIYDVFQKFTKPPEGEEFWGLTMLRALWATLGDLQGEMPKVAAFWKGVFLDFFTWLAEQVAGAASTLGGGLKSGAKTMARGALKVALPWVGGWVADQAFGDGAAAVPANVSPVTPIAPPSGARSSSRTFAPTIQVNATTGASPEDIAGAIDARLRAEREAWLRETADDVG